MSQKKEQTPDVFGVNAKTADDDGEEEEVTNAEIVQIVAAPPGWSAVITKPSTPGFGVLPVACFALVEMTFLDNTMTRQIVAQVVSVHGRFVDADSLEGFVGLASPGVDPRTVLATLMRNTVSEG